MAYRAQFGEAVRRAIGDTPYRRIAQLADLSPAYVADLVQGRVPKPEVVIALARATGTDIDELLAIAGYADWSPPWDPDAALVAGVRELQAEFGPFQWSTEMIPLSRATPEEIEAILADIRARVEERMRKG